jgi:hypothetical protein
MLPWQIVFDFLSLVRTAPQKGKGRVVRRKTAWPTRPVNGDVHLNNRARISCTVATSCQLVGLKMADKLAACRYGAAESSTLI